MVTELHVIVGRRRRRARKTVWRLFECFNDLRARFSVVRFQDARFVQYNPVEYRWIESREHFIIRDRDFAEIGARLIVHTNTEAIAEGTQPFLVGTKACCGALKTKGLLDALSAGGYDAAFGGARRDEEKSRAKERVLRRLYEELTRRDVPNAEDRRAALEIVRETKPNLPDYWRQ